MPKITKSLILIVMLAVVNCYSQPDAFQSGKKYIQLATGIKMAYTDIGHNHLETILLLHGYTDSSRSFQHTMEELYRLNPQSRIIVPDLRGHGSSGLPKSSEEFKISDFTNDILDLLEQLKVAKVDIVGHSFGTVIAQTIAVSHPEKVKSLVLMGTLINGKKNVVVQDVLIREFIYGQWKTQLQNTYGNGWKAKTFQLTPLDLGEHVAQFLKENWVSESRADTLLLNAIAQETIETPLVTWFGTLKTLADFDNFQSICRLQVPTLIIYGEDDEITPDYPDQQDLKTALQQAADNFQTPIYFKTYKRTDPNQLKIGHNFHWAFAKEVAADIMIFTQKGYFDNTFESEMYQFKNTSPLGSKETDH